MNQIEAGQSQPKHQSPVSGPICNHRASCQATSAHNRGHPCAQNHSNLKWYVVNVCGIKNKLNCPDFIDELATKDNVVLTEAKVADTDTDFLELFFSKLSFTLFLKNRFDLQRTAQTVKLACGSQLRKVFSILIKTFYVELFIYHQRAVAIATRVYLMNWKMN